jgi:predicted alpha/beta-hydrolase family hydrolase
MHAAETQPATISVDDERRVSGLLQAPREARACYVLAHGAGAGMKHPFLAEVANEFAGRGIATLRYQFQTPRPWLRRLSGRQRWKQRDSCLNSLFSPESRALAGG